MSTQFGHMMCAKFNFQENRNNLELSNINISSAKKTFMK